LRHRREPARREPPPAADIFGRVGETIFGVTSRTFRRVDLRRLFACITGDDLRRGLGMPLALHSFGSRTATLVLLDTLCAPPEVEFAHGRCAAQSERGSTVRHCRVVLHPVLMRS
jgi:hypothetical protein